MNEEKISQQGPCMYMLLCYTLLRGETFKKFNYMTVFQNHKLQEKIMVTVLMVINEFATRRHFLTPSDIVTFLQNIAWEV